MAQNKRLISTISPEGKLTPWLYMADLGILLAVAAFYSVTRSIIQDNNLNTLYGVILAVCAVWSIYQPKSNPGKRNWQVVQLAFKKNNTTYFMVTREELECEFDSLRRMKTNKRYLDLNKSEGDFDV